MKSAEKSEGLGRFIEPEDYGNKMGLRVEESSVERKIIVKKKDDDTQRRQEISLLTILAERHPEKVRELANQIVPRLFGKARTASEIIWRDGDSDNREQP